MIASCGVEFQRSGKRRFARPRRTAQHDDRPVVTCPTIVAQCVQCAHSAALRDATTPNHAALSADLDKTTRSEHLRIVPERHRQRIAAQFQVTPILPSSLATYLRSLPTRRPPHRAAVNPAIRQGAIRLFRSSRFSVGGVLTWPLHETITTKFNTRGFRRPLHGVARFPERAALTRAQARTGRPLRRTLGTARLGRIGFERCRRRSCGADPAGELRTHSLVPPPAERQPWHDARRERRLGSGAARRGLASPRRAATPHA